MDPWWTLGMFAVALLSATTGLPEVTDICTHCSCQYLVASHLTETVCTTDGPVLEVNCASRPKIKQAPNEIPNAPTSSNSTTVVWLSYKGAGLTSLQPFSQFHGQNVTTLSLDHNRLVYIPPRALSGLSQLTIVTASHNDIGSVAHDAFKGLRHLRHVDLSFNSLLTLDFKLLLDAVNLISFDVHNNSIKSIISPEVKLNTLETLDLSSNRIPDFPLLFFSSFKNLLKLNMSFNELEVLTVDLFQELTNLKVLDASGNEIKSIDSKVMRNLTNLNRLRLSDNQLSDVDFVQVIPRLSVLDVNNNRLSSMGDALLSSSVQRLVVSRNNLTDLSHVFKVFDKLKSMDASWNPCGVFPEHVRAGLRELLLDGCPLSSWPSQRPADGFIDHLSLSHIPAITNLGPFAFSGILKPKNVSGKCVSLEMRNNSLGSVDEDAFRDIDICQVDLSHNKLRWLPPSLLDWTSLAAADLQANPWHCDCALQWMLSKLVPSAYHSDQALLEDLRCRSPPELAGMRLVHWYQHGDEALCDPSGGGLLMAKPRAGPSDPAGHLFVTVSSSPLMIAVLLGLSVLAAMLVILGLALQRRAIRQRKVRRNRRF